MSCYGITKGFTFFSETRQYLYLLHLCSPLGWVILITTSRRTYVSGKSVLSEQSIGFTQDTITNGFLQILLRLGGYDIKGVNKKSNTM